MSFISKIKDKAKIGVGAVGFFLFGWLGWWGYGEIQSYEDVIRIYDRNIETACFVGDTGVANEAQKSVVSLMKRSGCLDVFDLGDLVYPNGLTDERDINFLKIFGPFLQFNTHVVLGNHERYQRRQTEIWKNLAVKNSFFFPHHYWGVIYEDACILGFEGGIYTTAVKGEIEKEQNNFIDSFVNDSRCSNKIKFAIAHHPYLSSGSHGDSKGRLKDMYEEKLVGKVQFLIGGHDHNLSYEHIVSGTTTLVSGSGSKLRECREKLKPMSKCWAKHGFIKFDFSGSGTMMYDFMMVE